MQKASTTMNSKIKTMMTGLAAGIAGAIGSAGALAQDLGVKAPPQKHPVLIYNATVHTVSGDTIESGYVLFDKGVITSVGSGTGPSLPPGTDPDMVDAQGMHVYPGLIGANTLTGLVEINSVRATADYAETGALTPEVRAAVAVNPDSTVIPVTRSNGILTVGVLPMGGTIPGRASVIRMDGWTWEDMAVQADAGLLVNWPNLRPISAWWMSTPEGEQRDQANEQLGAIDETFDAAMAYLRAKDADPGIPTDLRWEAMRGVFEGVTPVLVRANELDQIRSAVTWAVGRGLRCVIVGGRDANLCTDLLKRHDIGVIVTGTHRLPKRRDSAYDEPFTLPKELEEAGVRWCLATGGGSFDTPHERNLPYHAATAVAFGLDHDAALRAITLSAAELLGVDDRLGSLEQGKLATVIMTDGSPLEVTTAVHRAWIDGREIDLNNKQKALYEKYLEKYRQLGIIQTNGGSVDAGEAGGGGSGGAGR